MRGSEYSELVAFVEVARERSFRRAATRLGVSASALSHTMRSLEQRMGAKLLNRTTRSVSPTEAGIALFERVAPAFAQIAGAVAAVDDYKDRPAGVVRVNLPSVAADMVIAPILGKFAQVYPDIRLELTIEDRFVDIVAGGFDVGVRPGEHLQRDMIGVRLTPDMRMAIVCSPAYLSGATTPEAPQQLLDHRLLMYRWKESNQVYPWSLKRAGEVVDILADGAVSTNDIGLLVSACVEGAGIACLVEQLVEPYLAEGKLVRILAEWCEPSPGFFLYYPSRQMSAAVRTFVEFLQQAARADAGAE